MIKKDKRNVKKVQNILAVPVLYLYYYYYYSPSLSIAHFKKKKSALQTRFFSEKIRKINWSLKSVTFGMLSLCVNPLKYYEQIPKYLLYYFLWKMLTFLSWLRSHAHQLQYRVLNKTSSLRRRGGVRQSHASSGICEQLTDMGAAATTVINT